MEEFVFDYNKYDSKNLTTDKEQVKKIIIDLQRRKELETRALTIVKFLIEGQLRPETFLRCLKHINQAYYDDVVEERSLSKLCGYPMCNKPLTKIYKQQFCIDPKNKKVYDVTNVQKFCSSFCYSASNHIRNQMNDEWNLETDITKFNLLSASDSISHGEETVLNPKNSSEKLNFVSVSSFTQMSLSEIDDPDAETRNTNSKVIGKNKNINVMNTLKECNEDADEIADNTLMVDSEKKVVLMNNKTDSIIASSNTNSKENKPSATDQVKNVTSKKAKKDEDNESQKLVTNKEIPSNNPTASNKSGAGKKTKSKTKTNKREKLGDILSIIRKSIFEWVTIETYRFLYGKEKIQSVLNIKQLNNQFQSLNLETTSDDIKEKYTQVIHKLKLSELQDENFDKSVFGKTLLKPAPNYEQLRAEAEYKMLKIRALCGGNFYDVKSKNKEQDDSKNCELKEPSEIVEECDFVKTTSIQKTRRTIYIKSISPAMMKLTDNLCLPINVIMEELTLLVETFNLDAHNILFKPAVWTILALVLIKILSIKNRQLKAKLENPQATAYMQIMYNYIPNAKTQIEELLIDVADFNVFLKNYLSTNEVTKNVA